MSNPKTLNKDILPEHPIPIGTSYNIEDKYCLDPWNHMAGEPYGRPALGLFIAVDYTEYYLNILGFFHDHVTEP